MLVDDPTSVPTKQCRSCRAILPIQMFGMSRYEKDGYNFDCKLCRNQYYTMSKVRKFHSTPRKDQEFVRNIRYNNLAILEKILDAAVSCSIYGFEVTTFDNVKVSFDFSHERVSLEIVKSTTNSPLAKCYHVKSQPDLLNILSDWIRGIDIRLDWNQTLSTYTKYKVYGR